MPQKSRGLGQSPTYYPSTHRFRERPFFPYRGSHPAYPGGNGLEHWNAAVNPRCSRFPRSDWQDSALDENWIPGRPFIPKMSSGPSAALAIATGADWVRSPPRSTRRPGMPPGRRSVSEVWDTRGSTTTTWVKTRQNATICENRGSR
jgi:hypothetical protein